MKHKKELLGYPVILAIIFLGVFYLVSVNHETPLHSLPLWFQITLWILVYLFMIAAVIRYYGWHPEKEIVTNPQVKNPKKTLLNGFLLSFIVSIIVVLIFQVENILFVIVMGMFLTLPFCLGISYYWSLWKEKKQCGEMR